MRRLQANHREIRKRTGKPVLFPRGLSTQIQSEKNFETSQKPDGSGDWRESGFRGIVTQPDNIGELEEVPDKAGIGYPGPGTICREVFPAYAERIFTLF